MTSKNTIRDCTVMASTVLDGLSDFELEMLQEFVCEIGERKRLDSGTKAPVRIQDRLAMMLLIGAAFVLAVEERASEEEERER